VIDPTAATALPPPIPSSTAWVDVLHWCVRVMDVDDPDLGFAASILSHAIKFDGLSEKQARYAQRIFDRLATLYHRQQLPGQIAATALAMMQVQGNA